MDDTGIIRNIERIHDEDGKLVTRVVVDFYDWNWPSITIGTVWNRIPVKITESVTPA